MCHYIFFYLFMSFTVLFLLIFMFTYNTFSIFTFIYITFSKIFQFQLNKPLIFPSSTILNSKKKTFGLKIISLFRSPSFKEEHFIGSSALSIENARTSLGRPTIQMLQC